jgi:uncharacterized protein
MPAELRRLLIVANSARAIAESAARGGYAVEVVDCFCDEDTRALGRCVTVPLRGSGLDRNRLLATLEALALSADALVYGAGLEAAPETLDWFSGRMPVLGNRMEVLQLLARPAQFFALLDEQEIRYPETRFDTPPGRLASQWLVKEAGTTGGTGVRRWGAGVKRPQGEHYFQRFLDGPVMSVLFIADGRRAEMIGLSRLLTVVAKGECPFLYGGAIAGAVLSDHQQEDVRCAVEKLVQTLGLRGINNLDFILHKGRMHLLELNPRPSATLSLYEPGCEGGWMRRHLDACLGEVPPRPAAGGGQAVHGHRVVYALAGLTVPTGVRWPSWAKDRPNPGSAIAAGAPLCTVLASGEGAVQVERQLLARERSIRAMLLEGQVTEQEGIA